ncbi:hypothetical protein CTZ27_00890 [Streptomyces griseocarneus]|nr:hypothetical protein CTZ27_00890 [Streptomyces griseocarneus]
MSLGEVNERSALLARFDRSYLVPVRTFLRLAEQLTDSRRRGGGGFRALTIDGRRAFRYHSTYYDTPGLRSFHDHRQGRRLRFKIRERVYEDTGERQFEIKLKGGRGDTVKHRRLLAGAGFPPDVLLDVPPDAPPDISPDVLLGTPPDADCRAFLARTLCHAYGIDAPEGLAPSLGTDYLRVTLVADGERVTCDAGLVCSDLRTGRAVRCDPALVLVEVKTAGHLGAADRLLHACGVRPAVFTKYCGGFAALRPSLPANRWRRAAARAFGAPSPPGAALSADRGSAPDPGAALPGYPRAGGDWPRPRGGAA